MPPRYLILRQNNGEPSEVIFFDSDKQTSEVKFTGGRWAARRYLHDLIHSNGWEHCPAFCEKRIRNGRRSIIEMNR